MKEGKISPDVVSEFDNASRGLALPKHVKDNKYKIKKKVKK